MAWLLELRQHSPGLSRWKEFETWLEQDSSHRETYFELERRFLGIQGRKDPSGWLESGEPSLCKEIATVQKARRRNDRHILGTLYRRYFRRLKRQLQRSLVDSQQAEDCAQETFTRVGERGGLDNVRLKRAYLHRIVRNLQHEVSRIVRSEREVLTVSSSLADVRAERPAHPSFGMTEVECELDLATVVRQLQGRRGSAFSLLLEGYSYREIALRLGISEAAVGQDLMRARMEIEKMLSSRGGAVHDNRRVTRSTEEKDWDHDVGGSVAVSFRGRPQRGVRRRVRGSWHGARPRSRISDNRRCRRPL
jgi:RNA polymerase sigma-70 factor (ECF subfamily)